MRRWLVVVVVLAGCGHKSSAPDAPTAPDSNGVIDTAPPPPGDAPFVDTAFTCTSPGAGGDSCDAPLFDSSIQPTWPLEVMGDGLTITAQGFDTPTIGCTGGAWTAGAFDCRAQWQRAGRFCDLDLHLRIETGGTLTFWVGTVTSQTASCTSN